MKTSRLTIYLIGILLVISSIISVIWLATGYFNETVSLNNIGAGITFIIDLIFLFYAYSIFTNPAKLDSYAQVLNKPVGSFAKLKIPRWLIIYALVLVGLMIYASYKGEL